MTNLPRWIIYTFFTVIFVAALSTSASAKELSDTKKIAQVSEYFMGQLLSGEIESGYSLMSAYLGVDINGFIEKGKKADNDIRQLQNSIGKPLSYALLKQENVGEHFYKLTYLLKYQAAALVWEINYYQPDSGWKLVDISFNGDINALFN